jgi:hypothetical protein
MLFSVTYSIDVPDGESIDNYAPPSLKELWDETEGDDEYGYPEGASGLSLGCR